MQAEMPKPQDSSEPLHIAPPIVELPKTNNDEDVKKFGQDMMELIDYQNADKKASKIAEEMLPKVAADGGGVDPPEPPENKSNFNYDNLPSDLPKFNTDKSYEDNNMKSQGF